MSPEPNDPSVTEEFYAHNHKAENFRTLDAIVDSLPKRMGFRGLVVLNEYEVMAIVNTCIQASGAKEPAK